MEKLTNADQKFIIKEEHPDRILITIFSETIKSATNFLMITVPACLVLMAIPLGLYLVRNSPNVTDLLYAISTATLPICALIDVLIIISLVRSQISLFRKASSPPTQNAIFDLRTGLATGIKEDFADKKRVPWQFEIKQAVSITIGWDDPRFDMALLEIRDSSGGLLHTFYGGRADMRQIGEKLGVWLRIPINDQARDWDPKQVATT